MCREEGYGVKEMRKQKLSSSGKLLDDKKRQKVHRLLEGLAKSLVQGFLKQVSFVQGPGSLTWFPAGHRATISTRLKDKKLSVVVELDSSKNSIFFQVLERWFRSGTLPLVRLESKVELEPYVEACMSLLQDGMPSLPGTLPTSCETERTDQSG